MGGGSYSGLEDTFFLGRVRVEVAAAVGPNVRGKFL